MALDGLSESNSISISDEERQLVVDLAPHVEIIRVNTFRSLDELWQPDQFLPDFRDFDKAMRWISDLQKAMSKLPDELVFIFICNMMTEEGLTLFTAFIDSLQGVPYDENGENPYTKSNRQWGAEEFRHELWGRSMMEYSGRVDMPHYNLAQQLFLRDGIDINTDRSVVKTFYYTSFQELATKRSHKNTQAALAPYDIPGNEVLGLIAGDEAVHAKFYMLEVKKMLELNPSLVLIAIADMMERMVKMPASNMRQFGESPGDTFEVFSDVAQKLGIYTFKDYVEISRQILNFWKIEVIEEKLLTAEGIKAKKFIKTRQKMLERALRTNGPTFIKNADAVPDGEYPWVIAQKYA